MPRAAGLVGAHRSRRPGEGGELAGVRLFAPGRPAAPHRLAGLAAHPAAARRGDPVRPRRRGGAAARRARRGGPLRRGRRRGVGAGHHGAGGRRDRRALPAPRRPGRRCWSTAPAARRLRPASGRRQYLTVLEWLLDVRADAVRRTSRTTRSSARSCSPRTRWWWCSPRCWTRGRRRCSPGWPGPAGSWSRSTRCRPTLAAAEGAARGPTVAHRLWRLERENMIGQLREHGVPVVAWAGAGSLDQVLRDVARLAAGPEGGGCGEREPVAVERRSAASGSGRRVARSPRQPGPAAGARPGSSSPCWPALAAGVPGRGAAPAGRSAVLAVAALLPAVAAAPGLADLRGAGHGRRLAARHRSGTAGRSRCGGCSPSPRCSTWCTPLRALAAVLPYDAVVDPGC